MRSYLAVVISVFILVCCTFCKASSEEIEVSPTYTTKYGKVEGYWKTTFGGRKYAAFEGIPYAKPPVGDLKFEEPQPISSWKGVWKATRVNECLQTTMFYSKVVIGDEDCLYVNIYVPETQKTGKLDVVVHIHGGGFVEGYGWQYTDPKYVLDRDLIFVTIHYRLGALGFLSTGDNILPGNNGLKDQALALKWIKENIESFGGNSNSITLTGFSAGAASVHYHYFSPLSRKLFNRGMSVSGSSLNGFALQYNPIKRAERLGKALLCDTSDKRTMIECIKSRPSRLILNATVEMNPFKKNVCMPFVPVIERESRNAFISQHPYKMLKEGKVFDVPWIASSTTDEGLVLSIAVQQHIEEFDRKWSDAAKYLLLFEDTALKSMVTEISEKIKKFYSPNGIEFKSLTKMLTDRLIGMDSELAAKMQSKVTTSPVYYYKFGYPSRNSFKDLLTTKHVDGTSHGDDMVYFFGGLITKPLSEEDIKLKDIALDILFSYAHTGVPVVPNVKWSPVGKQFNFLNITGPDNIKLDVKTDFSTEQFWTSLGLMENDNIFPNIKTEL